MDCNIDSFEYLEPNKERKYRIIYALNAVGLPIIAGDITTVCGLIPIATATSAIFTAFFKCLLLVMMFGMMHALFYLPVILSFVGPVTSKKKPVPDQSNIELGVR
mmetsp:Transcript_73813/g.90617  ORF Transcript_73813/g.90617 Transcript_73813/m.90617 type:complete len:105 (-) Transcript_73813:32-346(-)